MSSLSLKGRVAIITGSSSGLGQATAVLFAQRDCSVVLSGTNEKRLQETLEKCQKAGLKRDQILTVAGDITTHKTREEIVTRTFGKFKRIDILVNNAGSIHPGFIKDLEEKDIDTTFNLNFKAPVLLSKLAFPYLKKTKGNIINVSSALSAQLTPELTMYGIAKGALDNFTKAASNEWGPAGIRVNSVSPGSVITPLLSSLVGDNEEMIKMIAEVQGKLHALQRNGEPNEIAEGVAFLASDAASFVSGTVLSVDGGRHCFSGGVTGSMSGKSPF